MVSLFDESTKMSAPSPPISVLAFAAKEGVVATAAFEHVVFQITVEDVIARGTLKSVVSLIAGEEVITGSANFVLRTHWLFAMADLSLERASSSFLSLI